MELNSLNEISHVHKCVYTYVKTYIINACIYIYANDIRHKYKYDIYVYIYIFLMQQFELDQKCLSSTSGIQAGLELILFK